MTGTPVGIVPVGKICIVGSVVVGTGSGKRLNKIVPPPKPGTPPPRPKAISVVKEGIAAGILTVVAIVGRAEVIGAINGKGARKVVGKTAPAVRFTIMLTVGVRAGWRDGTSEVTVSPAAVTCGTTTVKGLKLGDVKGIAAVLNILLTGDSGEKAGAKKGLKVDEKP